MKPHRIVIFPFDHRPHISLYIFPKTSLLFDCDESVPVEMPTVEIFLEERGYRLDRRHLVEWRQSERVEVGHEFVKYYTEVEYFRGIGPLHALTWEKMELVKS